MVKRPSPERAATTRLRRVRPTAGPQWNRNVWTLKRHSWPRDARRVTQEAVTRARLVDVPRPRLCQLIEQRLRLSQNRGAEALGEPAVDRRQQIAGFQTLAVVAPQPGEASRGAQFLGLGALLLGQRKHPVVAGRGTGSLFLFQAAAPASTGRTYADRQSRVAAGGPRKTRPMSYG